MKKSSVLVLSLAILMVSCTQVNHEGIGMASGGLVGGLIGSQFGGGAGKVAAAAGGAFIGAVLGGQIGKYMDKQDAAEMQRALETAPTGKAISWRNPDSGNSYRVTPTRTYYVHDHQPCREYTTRAMIGGKAEQVYGKACRQADGSWQIVS